MKTITYIVATSVAIALTVWILSIGIAKQEQVECIKLREQAQTYQNFYYTDWQEKMCEHYNLK